MVSSECDRKQLVAFTTLCEWPLYQRIEAENWSPCLSNGPFVFTSVLTFQDTALVLEL